MYSIKMGSNVKFCISQIAFVLLTISMFGGLSFAVWNLKSENANLQNQISELRGFVGANPNPHSSDEATVMDTLKRLTRQSSSSQSATDLLADALAELIEKKLYTIMDCARDDADNLTDCSLKPGPKGDKGCLGDQGKEGPQGMNGEPGVKGHNGYPGHKGEVGPKGPIGDLGPMGHRGVKGDMGEIGQRGEAGVKGDEGMKGEYGFPGHKGESGGPGAKGVKGDRGFGGNNGQKGEKGMTGVQGPPGPIPTTQPPTTEAMTTQPPTVPSERCGGPGWRKVAFIDMTNTSQNCPQGLTLTGYSKRSCGRTHATSWNCSSVTFPVGGGQYSRVCGRAKAYQYGVLASFYGYHNSRGINAVYVAGLSFTHGTPRTHIWTFAAGYYQGISGDSSFRNYRCPCNPGNSIGSPPFVGNDYFCESGVSSRSAVTPYMLHPDDPLWDGQGCIHGNTCCQLNNPPWFNKTLPTPTTDDIEMRLCMSSSARSANIALEQMELYVY
ncbi:collagen alpha-1(XVII) chain-like [Halichondria panicea]|uniref:collagen alpha-1(XVII) chain-like n=1 Tax=Halichondria panicea TaxID=6063 RepID=UPI00312B5309